MNEDVMRAAVIGLTAKIEELTALRDSLLPVRAPMPTRVYRPSKTVHPLLRAGDFPNPAKRVERVAPKNAKRVKRVAPVKRTWDATRRKWRTA